VVVEGSDQFGLSLISVLFRIGWSWTTHKKPREVKAWH